MTDYTLDPVHQKIVLGMAACAAKAVERARQTGTPLIIWRDNQVVKVDPDDLISQQPDSSKKP